ncbi:MAG: hypothetical protein AAGK21_01175 [Bacteroidota bacterium]
MALIGALAGSLAIIPPPDTGDDDKKKSDANDAAVEAEATPGVFEQQATEASYQTPHSTYAQGRSSTALPLKLWAQYSYGITEDVYNRQGETDPLSIGGPAPIGTVGESVSQRAQVGAQFDFLNLPRFQVGAGAMLSFAKTDFTAETVGQLGIGDIESDFGFQQVQVYGVAQGKTLGIHAGYSFDLGSAAVFSEPVPQLGGARLPQEAGNSDGRDAIFVGLNFDYPSERFRLLGGVDYYALQSGGALEDPSGNEIPGTNVEDGGDFLNFLFGAGLRFSIAELGATFQIQTRFDEPLSGSAGLQGGIGGHVGRVVPYLRVSPPNLPASLYIKGAVPDEYLEYGYTLGGSNSPNPTIGFTAGLAIGFE